MSLKICIKRIIGIYDFDRTAERLIKKSIHIYNKGGLINRVRAIRIYNNLRKNYNCDIWPGITFGNDNYIAHPNNILIGKTSIIGSNCKIYPNCQLIANLKNDDYLFHTNQRRHPLIKDGTIIGCGSIIIGPITIGENVTIGAGSIVTKDVPDNTTVINVNEYIRK